MPKPQQPKPQERRKYIRLDSVFPVEIYAAGGTRRFIQAFTRDVSLGGVCLSVNDPDQQLLALAKTDGSLLEIGINLPVSPRPIMARVRTAWHEIVDTPHHKRLLLGVSYDRINEHDRRRIVGRAQRMRWMPPAAVAAITGLTLLASGVAYDGYLMRERNRELIKRFYRVQETSAIYQRGVDKIEAQFIALQQEVRDTAEQAERLQAEMGRIDPLDAAAQERKSELERDLAAIAGKRTALEARIASLREKKERTEALFTDAKERRRELEEATAQNMYHWLKTHRNGYTGLVMSYEGDPAVRDWAFTYDQSLAAQAFLISRDTELAEAILSFYADRAKRRDGGLMNAYNVLTGEPTEDVVHMGPTIWIGIAAVQHAHQTGQTRFLKLAEEIARWAISRKDADGGLSGGPGVTWYSTEHNLDAYALFSMLAEVTGQSRYREAAAGTLNWIKQHTYSSKDGAMKRGKGDATIATDTLAWAVAAIGPATLLKEGMDPDVMMRFAEDECRITTTFTRPDGEVVEVTGFDFAKGRNAARGGVVSTEWTAQMVMAFKIMADFHADLDEPKRSEEYRRKAEFYLGELDKMVISSPSPSGQGAGCLPYASQPNADTGHGWRTPNGAATGSVSGTAYTLFAKRDYNPLALE